MKITLFIFIISVCFFLISGSCNEEFKEKEGEFQEELFDSNVPQFIIGTWIEKNPELFDGVSDTLEFGDDNIIYKYFLFKNSSYSFKNDTLYIDTGTLQFLFHVSVISNEEIIINGFLDRLITENVKNIPFIKIN